MAYKNQKKNKQHKRELANDESTIQYDRMQAKLQRKRNRDKKRASMKSNYQPFYID